MLAVIDLATNETGSFGDSAIYSRTVLGAAGSGNIDSFVRIQQEGTEQGYNSSFRPVQFNEDSTATFNHDLLLTNVPIVVIDGVPYREFLLDTNEPGGTERFISLNKLEIYVANAGSINQYPFNDATGPTATKIYDMDAGTAGTDTAAPSANGNWVLIDNNLGSGSGNANAFVYIPNALFTGGTFVTLYSQFGVTVPSSSGGEEWAVREATALFSISGRKFNDLDGDHTDDGGTDPGLAGWTIYLDTNNNNQLDAGEPAAVTAADGSYTLGSLLAGTYEVCEVQQAGWTQTFPQTLDGCHTVVVGPNAVNIDFGNNSTVTTTGTKFNDLDGDGVRDVGEPGLLNWEIRAYADANGNNLLDQGEFDGGAAAAAFTNASGEYQLLLSPGAYVLVEVQQSGWTQTAPAGVSILAIGLNTGATVLGGHGHPVTLLSGQNVSGRDFGNFDNVDLSGQKFHDLDGDGIKDVGEPGLLGWTIQLDRDANGTVDATTATDASGNYSFTNLGPGVYRIREVQQAGWTQTTANPADVAAVSGQNVSGVDFGNFQNINISGQKFNDLDGDGIKDLGEPGLLGWTIQLDAGANGTVDATTATDASGNYSFANLGPGTYRIREVQQAGWTQTTVNPADIVASGGTNVANVDFGNFQLVSISGQKFNDLDGDGIKDLGEPGLLGWTIQLDVGANGTVDATTATDASGNYSFSNLGPGTYRIREVQQAGWTQTTVNPADITTVSGQNVSGIHFGNFQNINVSGQKFHDLDGDGIKDLGEPGLLGWTIQLDVGANGTVDATTATDASGNYSFANLGPGTYRIREVQQAGWTQTTANPADVAAVSGQNVSGINFGNFQNIDISGQKFNDLDGDGIKDALEPGLFNWTIQLDLNADGSVESTTTTDALGNYSFTNLGPGTYRIREVQQPTWTQTTANPADITAVGGTNVADVDFGNSQALSISGQKFNDLDGDGIKDLGEPGLLGWTIQLDAGADGSVDAVAVTDASGNYTFANVAPGLYRVREVQQAGWTQTTVNPADFLAVSGQSVSGVDFGNFQLVSISGQKFHDLDGDGIKDLGEPGLLGWTIQLDRNADGSVDATTITDAAGNYSFVNLVPGTYRIREVQQVGWTQTTVNPADISVISGQIVTGIDFGNFELIEISGQKFDDLDGDGVRDLGEGPLAGVTITLDIGADGTIDATTTTDASGNYSFSDLPPGVYRVREVVPAGAKQTTADPADIVAQSGVDVGGIDFGNFELITISGQKFEDLDGDGVKDIGEPGLAGWTIELDYGANDSVNGTAITDADGNYSFAGLWPGVYRLREVQQSGWKQTTANPADIVAQSGTDVGGIDFGNFELITISGQKFHDLDGDGIKEIGELGLAGWTIQLDMGPNGSINGTAVTDADGNYSFGGLWPGVYRLREVQQSGWTQTTANPADIVAVSGTNVSGVDFGNREVEGDIIVIGPDKSPTVPAPVLVLDQSSGEVLASFLAYEPTFVGGTRVATGDLTGDGIDEVVTAPGRGRVGEIRVFTQDGVELTEFRTLAYPAKYKGGVQVAVGDVNGDGRADIVTARSSGNAIVRVFLGQNNVDPIANTHFKQFNAFGTKFVGGAFVRVADMGTKVGSTFNNALDNKAEIIVGSGPGIKAAIKVFNVNATPVAVRTINPFTIGTSVYKNGVNFDVADLNGDNVPDLVVGTENGGNSRVETFVWNGSAQLVKTGSFSAYADSPSKIAPVRVAALGAGDGIAEQIATVQGPNGTTQQVRLFDIVTVSPLAVTQLAALGPFPGPYFIAAIGSQPPTDPPILAAEGEGVDLAPLAMSSSASSTDLFDLNGDGDVTPSDVLLVINQLNRLADSGSSETASAAEADVTGDGNVSALDALMIINQLNRAAAALAPAIGEESSQDRYAADVDFLLADLEDGLLV